MGTHFTNDFYRSRIRRKRKYYYDKLSLGNVARWAALACGSLGVVLLTHNDAWQLFLIVGLFQRRIGASPTSVPPLKRQIWAELPAYIDAAEACR